MNYIEIINRFWQLRRACRLNSSEADLLFFLVQESNIRKWQNPFNCANGLICATLGMSESTLAKARNALVRKEFIAYQPGNRNKQSPVYQLIFCNSKPSEAKVKPTKANKANTKTSAKTIKSKSINPTKNKVEYEQF